MLSLHAVFGRCPTVWACKIHQSPEVEKRNRGSCSLPPSPMLSCPRRHLLQKQSGSSLATWPAGTGAAKDAFYRSETTAWSQNSFCFSKERLLHSEGFPPYPRRGWQAVLSAGPEILLAPSHPSTGLQLPAPAGKLRMGRGR